MIFFFLADYFTNCLKTADLMSIISRMGDIDIFVLIRVKRMFGV